jgi:hypothetical protein
MGWPDSSALKPVLNRAAALSVVSGQIVGAHHICRAVLLEPLVRELLALDEAGLHGDSDVAGFEGSDRADIHVSPGFRRIIDLALRESRELGDTHVGPEHVLLALIAAGEEASVGPVWFPFVGCVAPAAERGAVVDLVRMSPDITRVRERLAKHPSRTLLRAADGSESTRDLLRPAANQGDDDPETLLRAAP